MKRVLLFLFTIVLLFFYSGAQSQAYNSAVGIRISSGDAFVGTGVSSKHFIREKTALEGILSVDPLSLGILLEKHHATRAAGLDWFVGGGAYVGFKKRNNFGLLGIVGLDYKVPAIPLNLSLDWKPELYLIEYVDFEPAAVGFSVRFTF